MKKLSLSQWTSIAEIIGMIAVVVSLVFVGFEIRQNTQQAEEEALANGADFIKTVYSLVETPEKAEFTLKGLGDFDRLTLTEKAVFDAIMVNVTIDFDVIYEQYVEGKLREDAYFNLEEMMARVLLSPGAITWLEVTEHTFPPYLLERYKNIKANHADLEPLHEYFQYEIGGK